MELDRDLPNRGVHTHITIALERWGNDYEHEEKDRYGRLHTASVRTGRRQRLKGERYEKR